MVKTVAFSLRTIINLICDRLQNRFDTFLAIEGKRGLGKSTLGYKLAKAVKSEMKRRGVKGYNFKPKFDLLYTREDVIKFFNKWKHTGIADEMIMAGHNRDFYVTDQKDLIKMINMNRDHNNFFIACIPQFKVIDNQLKNLVCLKLTVVKRGVAILHTPNKTVYSSDIWDEVLNEKIERKWLTSGLARPKYSKLTTFRGVLRFSKLSEKEEEIYQKIKNEKRNLIAQEKGITDDKKETPFDIIFDLFINRKVRNSVMLDGMILSHKLNIESTKAKIRTTLKQKGLSTFFKNYYNDPEVTKSEEEFEKGFGKFRQLITPKQN